MKPIKKIYEEVYSFSNLYKAYINARMGKRFRKEVLRFSSKLEDNLLDIQRALKDKSYVVGKYKEFYVYEPKKRLIMTLPFRDRVVQWAIYLIVNPIFSNTYTFDSYGSISGKGTYSAIDRVKYWLNLLKKDSKCYYLKLDVSKYFYRIDHTILLDILRRKIDDSDMIWLFDKIINSDKIFGVSIPGIVESKERITEIGMPTGSLMSQMFANIYMNELDQYVKRELHIKYYVRYMDDIIILSKEKSQLHELKNEIESFLNNKLKLHLNSKTAIRPIFLGIDFVGYKIWGSHIKLRKSSVLRMKRRLKVIQKQFANDEIDFDKANQTIQSYITLLSHCNSLRLRYKIFSELKLEKRAMIEEL